MRRALAVVAALVVVAAALLTFNYLRPVPAVHASSDLPALKAVPGPAPALPWPPVGGAAVAVSGVGQVGSHDAGTAYPIASVAKIMTALVVLEDHPLATGQPGPVLSITDADRQDFQAKAAQGQSVVEVQPGEQLSEYQLLEGLLIPSGNNLADLLARWDAGSVDAFVTKMNSRARRLGMQQTHYDDTAGFSAKTVSTANDLVKLAPAAMALPVFAEIVAKPQTQLPVAGTVYNVDYTLGRDGIVGIKTGSSPDAGACFVFAANASVDNRTVQIYGAVIYQHTLDSAFAATRSLIEAVQPALHVQHLVSAGQRIGRYTAPWGSATDAVATADVDLVSWPGTVIPIRTSLQDLNAPIAAGSSVGSLQVGSGQFALKVPVVTSGPILAPGRRWRLLRTDLS